MSTWILETRKAIYLMKGGYWISRITKRPFPGYENEQVARITGLRSWFTRPDFPGAMVVAFDRADPPQMPLPATPPSRPPAPPASGGSSGTGSSANTDQISSDGLRLIKSFEGLELRAYQDSVGVWTIGYGHTAAAGSPDVYSGQTISEAEAEAILRRDLRKFENGVRDVVDVPLNSNQFSALVSFAFNVGVGALSNSTLLRKLNNRDYQGAANEFPRWVKAGGRTLQGLVRRRDAERALFLGQNYARYL